MKHHPFHDNIGKGQDCKYVPAECKEDHKEGVFVEMHLLSPLAAS